jgi:hypothetical protein
MGNSKYFIKVIFILFFFILILSYRYIVHTTKMHSGTVYSLVYLKEMYSNTIDTCSSLQLQKDTVYYNLVNSKSERIFGKIGFKSKTNKMFFDFLYFMREYAIIRCKKVYHIKKSDYYRVNYSYSDKIDVDIIFEVDSIDKPHLKIIEGIFQPEKLVDCISEIQN